MMKVVNQLQPTEAQMREMFADGRSSAPFCMLNLLKFRVRAEYPDGRESNLTGQEAYGLYGARVAGLVAELGGRIVFQGPVAGLMLGEVEELWDAVAVVEYPSTDAMMGMISSAEYQEIAVHRAAGLAGQLNMRVG